MSASRLLVLVLSTVVTTVLLGVGHAPEADADCAGPSMAVGAAADPPSSGTELGPGARLTVSGVFFHGGCEDTGGAAGLGCLAPQPPDPQFSLTGVELSLVQGDRTWALGTADAEGRDQLYKISWTITVPSDVSAGPAELRAATASLDVELR